MVSDHIFAGWVKCTVVVIPHMRMSSVHEDLPSSYFLNPSTMKNIVSAPLDVHPLGVTYHLRLSFF
jgi:hypothetical protein